jgi:hypothetical protein
LYKNSENSELNKILLINSFNEWGEDMAFEPSEKYKYYNLNLLFECLQPNNCINDETQSNNSIDDGTQI